MDGIFNILKPPAMTSQDVVAYLRRALGCKKMGHGGTLDPEAAGVLPVYCGAATRLLQYALDASKEYIGEFVLGYSTDSGDEEGKVTGRAPVPFLTQEKAENILKKFLGPQQQVPPMYSALKVGGQRLYRLARQGVEVERAPRSIFIHKLKLLRLRPHSFTLAITCSKGTYIRTLGEDIAAALGTLAAMTFLLRTRVGVFSVDEAASLDEVTAEPLRFLQPPLKAVEHLPKITLSPQQALRLSQGVATTVRPAPSAGVCVLLGPAGELLGLGEGEGERLRPKKIFFPYDPEAKKS